MTGPVVATGLKITKKSLSFNQTDALTSLTLTGFTFLCSFIFSLPRKYYTRCGRNWTLIRSPLIIINLLTWVFELNRIQILTLSLFFLLFPFQKNPLPSISLIYQHNYFFLFFWSLQRTSSSSFSQKKENVT